MIGKKYFFEQIFFRVKIFLRLNKLYVPTYKVRLLYKVFALSRNPHFIKLSFFRPIPVLSLFSVRQTDHA